MAKLNVQHHYFMFSMSRGHSNMLICCSTNCSTIINVKNNCAAQYGWGGKSSRLEVKFGDLIITPKQ